MKVLIFLAILVALTVATQYNVQIQWVYDPTPGVLSMFGSGQCQTAYQSYCNESLGWTFAPGDYEIGAAYDSLLKGKALYLSVQFLGADSFSRYDTATSLGLDYFTLTKTATDQIDEYF